ncbi:MAG: Holliday junction branch migration protein RuvA [Bacillota bacterium]
MIASLRGLVAERGLDHIVLSVGGVGLKVLVPPSALGDLTPGEAVHLHTQLVLREDAIALYGFLAPDQARLFHALLGVGGVGPKVAMAVVASLGPGEFSRALHSEDLAVLTNVPGVGRKTAQRIILDLKDRLPDLGPALSAGDAASEAVAGLVALGYPRNRALQAVEAVLTQATPNASAEAILRLALGKL